MKRKTEMKGVLSCLLALVLVFSITPSVFAEEPVGVKTIYVDAIIGDDTQEGVGTTAEKAYQSIGEAVKVAKSGDTIKLAKGNYSLYDVCGKNGASNSEEYTKKKNLTFEGQGVDKTNWYIGANPTPEGFNGEYDGDYCFDGAKTITFKNLTLQAGPGRGEPHEHPRHPGRQLDLAAAARRAERCALCQDRPHDRALRPQGISEHPRQCRGCFFAGSTASATPKPPSAV